MNKNERLQAFVDELAELCTKHGVYLLNHVHWYDDYDYNVYIAINDAESHEPLGFIAYWNNVRGRYELSDPTE